MAFGPICPEKQIVDYGVRGQPMMPVIVEINFHCCPSLASEPNN
jgi:hypothetical protein